MNFDYIARNLHKFHRIDCEKLAEAIYSLLTVMLSKLLGPGVERDLRGMLLEPGRLEVLALVDVDFSSDENCIIQVLVADGKPVCLCSKFGDRSEWKVHILDLEAYHVTVKEIAALVLQQRMSNIIVEPLERLQDLENHYIRFLGEKETMFAIERPRAAEYFGNVLTTHRCFVVNPDGSVQEVEEIGKFSNRNHSSWDTGPGSQDVGILVKGAHTSRVVDGRELMFELVSGEADIADALTSYSKSSRWIVDTVDERKRLVKVLAYRAYHREVRPVMFQLESDGELKRFCELYFDHEIENQYIDGEFVFTTLGFKGAIIKAA